MGILGLTKLLAEFAKGAMKEDEIKNYFGRVIAVDASMSLYQFVIAVRPDDLGQYSLTNDMGESTSHLQLFYRTIRLITNGIKPVFVFDGKPPELKSREIEKRKERKKNAEEKLEEAEDENDKEAIAKFNKQTVRVTPQMNEDAKRLLRLMGVPVVQAPCEAEAQCAELVKKGKCYGVASEDMDTLTCGSPVLVRHMTYAEARKVPIMEFSLDKALAELELTHTEFIDLCILLGCDYADKIRGIGPKRALELIKQYRSIEKILENIDTTKYTIPEHFPYQEIREYFQNPPVTDATTLDLSASDPDEEGLVQFLCVENGFNEERVRGGIAKIRAARGSSVQARLTNFFTVQSSPSPSASKSKAATPKRKGGSDDSKSPKKKFRK